MATSLQGCRHSPDKAFLFVLFISFHRLDLMKTECRSNLWIFPHTLRLTWMENLQFLNQLNVDARSDWPNLMLTRFQNMKKSMKRNSLTSNTLQRCIAMINRWTDYCNNREIIVSDYWLSQNNRSWWFRNKITPMVMLTPKTIALWRW